MLEVIKWSATAILIVGFGFASYGVYPLGPLIQLAGGVLWFTASVKMRDLPLMVTNGVMTSVGAAALLLKYFG